MNDDACQTFTRTFSVGRYRVTVRAPMVAGKSLGIYFEWSPDVPRRLSPVLLKEYLHKRDRTFWALAKELGGAVAVADGFGGSVIKPDGSEPEPLVAAAEQPPAPKVFTLETAYRKIKLEITEHPDRIAVETYVTKIGALDDSDQFTQWAAAILATYDADPRPFQAVNQETGETVIVHDDGIAVYPPGGVPPCL